MTKKFRTIKKFRGITVAAVALGVVASTAAISSGAPPEAETAKGGLPALIQTAIDQPGISAAEREALKSAKATGRIDPADNKRAHLRYEKCMNAKGYNPEFRQSAKGFYVELPYEGVKDTAALDAAVMDCSVGNSTVQALYRIQQANPQVITDRRVVAVNCLTEQGFAKAEYTAEQFERDFATDQFPFDAAAPGPNDCLYGAGYAYFELDE